MLTAYGDIRSGNCLKVKWLLDRLGRDYRWVEVDIMSGGSRTPEFLAMSGAGQVPVIVLEDGRPLAQSNAILLLLAEGTDLIPADPYDRARMLEWLFWEQYSHEPYVAVARFQRLYLGKTEVEARIMERGDAALDRLDAALVGREWLVGEAVSLADIALVAYTRMAGDGGFDLAARPGVRAWVARVERALGIGAYW
ncbi:glutathione S-transferase family protein [Brevundimonas sp.]|uniref:glutathione S-transferase family protein n=1 Tax=Brevundimonas sp. TaxID=1871086 RepID=UPI001A17F246|nr:glutathione S-transferase family protein [Brevundimonas sp.]MBJ7483798.1 glutathione S-transferase family protein [Brevundimonas sp.]